MELVSLLSDCNLLIEIGRQCSFLLRLLLHTALHFRHLSIGVGCFVDPLFVLLTRLLARLLIGRCHVIIYSDSQIRFGIIRFLFGLLLRTIQISIIIIIIVVVVIIIVLWSIVVVVVVIPSLIIIVVVVFIFTLKVTITFKLQF